VPNRHGFDDAMLEEVSCWKSEFLTPIAGCLSLLETIRNSSRNMGLVDEGKD